MLEQGIYQGLDLMDSTDELDQTKFLSLMIESEAGNYSDMSYISIMSKVLKEVDEEDDKLRGIEV